MTQEHRTIIGEFDKILQSSSRRDFARILALGGMATFLPTLITACGDDNSTNVQNNRDIDFSTDTGILNYAYALEQLEAAFYTQVIATPYSSMPANELQVLGDIKQHEVIHRDFLKAALGNNRLADLTVNFSSINFSSRSSVLGTAKAFEDLGVSAYNGAGSHISSGDYVTLAGKIVSVEARHASAIRDLLNNKSADFAGDDVVDADTGLDQQKPPSIVLSNAGAAPYITTAITTKNIF